MPQICYKLSQHATKRAAQRNIPYHIVDLILSYGDSCDARGGARKFALSRRSLREIREDKAVAASTKLDHFRRAYVVATDEKVITTAFANKPIFH